MGRGEGGGERGKGGTEREGEGRERKGGEKGREREGKGGRKGEDIVCVVRDVKNSFLASFPSPKRRRREVWE